MNQSDSGLGILDLAKQAGARKSILKKLVLQCIQERGDATDDCRLERQVSLRKMTLEPRPVIAPVVADVPSTLPLEARMNGLESAFRHLAQTLTERLDLLSVDRAVDPTAAALLEVVDGLGAKLVAVDQKADVLRGDFRNLDLSVGHLTGQVKGIDQIFASLGRDANKLSNTIEALSGEVRKSQDRVAQIESAQLLAQASRAAELESLQKQLESPESPGQSVAEFSHLQNRLLEIESGFERVLTTVQELQRPPEDSYTDAEQEATAKVLASLTKLVEGMRSAQSQRQLEKGVQPS